MAAHLAADPSERPAVLPPLRSRIDLGHVGTVSDRAPPFGGDAPLPCPTRSGWPVLKWPQLTGC